MFVTDFGGSIYSARLDGSDKRMLLFAQGNLTGVAYANLVPQGEVIMATTNHSSYRDRRHGSHRRELGRPVPRARFDVVRD